VAVWFVGVLWISYERVSGAIGAGRAIWPALRPTALMGAFGVFMAGTGLAVAKKERLQMERIIRNALGQSEGDRAA
jgi:hypothetical protein